MSSFDDALKHLNTAVASVFDADPRVQSVGISADARGNYHFTAVRNADLAVPFNLGPAPAHAIGSIPVAYFDGHGDTEALVKVPVSSSGTPRVSSVLRERQRQRPLFCGVEIQNFDDDLRRGVFDEGSVIVGTLGCFVIRADSKVALLSNNHVVAGENRGVRQVDRITQPGVTQLGAGDQVAVLDAFVALKPSPVAAKPRLGNVVYNDVDAGTAVLTDSTKHTQGYLPGRPAGPAGSGPASLGDKVFKVGRTTGLTRGEIVQTNTVVGPVVYDCGPVWFHDCLVIQGLDGTLFSDHGDSGSAIVNAATKQIVGLLFAGNGSVTYACPIASVLSALNLQVA